MTNPLNNSWYSIGDNKYSTLDEVATATETREAVVQKEVESILASSECKHSVLEPMVDLSSVWIYASTIADDIIESLTGIEREVQYAEDLLTDGEFEVDSYDYGDEVKITVTKYDGNDDAKVHLRDAKQEISSLEDEVRQKLSDISQEDIDPQNMYHLCVECKATFNHEEVKYVHKAAQ